jgi:hypothetical protein
MIVPLDLPIAYKNVYAAGVSVGCVHLPEPACNNHKKHTDVASRNYGHFVVKCIDRRAWSSDLVDEGF